MQLGLRIAVYLRQCFIQYVSSPAASLRYNCAAYDSLCRRSLLTRLMVALVLSRLDYCNGVLAGLPDSRLSRLQSVQSSTRQRD